MFDSAVVPSKGLGCNLGDAGLVRADQRLAAHDRHHHGLRPRLGSGRSREPIRKLLVDHAAALCARSTPVVTITGALPLHPDGGEAADYGAVDDLMALPII